MITNEYYLQREERGLVPGLSQRVKDTNPKHCSNSYEQIPLSEEKVDLVPYQSQPVKDTGPKHCNNN